MFPLFIYSYWKNIASIENGYTYKVKLHSAVWKSLNGAIDLTKDNIKRRAFHLRCLIDHIKNKKNRKKIIAEYVILIQQMSPNN